MAKRTNENKPERGTGTDSKGDPARNEAYGDAELAQSELVNTEPYHRPGAPLETKADREAREAKADEPAVDTRRDTLPEYDGVDTRDPVANLRTRSNIVSDGPGTVQDPDRD